MENKFIGIPIPEDCKGIYLCMDREQFEKWKKKNTGMKTLLCMDETDEFYMPVFIGYRPVTPDQTQVEALGCGPVDG